MTATRDEVAEVLSVIASRAPLIEALLEEPKDKRELVEALDVSRSTVDRGVREVEVLGLVEYTSTGFAPTLSGRLLMEEYHAFTNYIENILNSQDVVSVLASYDALDPIVLAGAEIVSPGGIAPISPGDHLLELLRGATRCRVLSRANTIPDSGNVIRQEMVQNGMEYEGVFQADMLEHVRSEYPVAVEEMVTRDTCMIASIESLPFGLFLLDRAEGTWLCVVVYTDVNQFGGLIINDSNDAIEWGERTFKEYSRQAEPIRN